MPLEEILSECVPRVFRFALRLTLDRHRAEDLTQETFLRAWRGRADLRDERAARLWLLQIARNLWRDELRRGQRDVLEAGRPEEYEELRPRPEQAASEREELAHALAGLDSLPPRQREVLYLVAVEGLSLSEVSQMLEISRNAAKVNLCLARKAMRKLVEKPVEGAR